MKTIKWLIVCLMVLGGAVLAGDTGFAGRYMINMTTNGIVNPKYSTAVRAASVSIRFNQPVTGTVEVWAVQGTVPFLRATTVLSAATNMVYLPTDLWIRSGDYINIKVSTNVSSSVAVDYAY